MPILKRFEGNRFREDFDEINEHLPLFIDHLIEEEILFQDKKDQSKFSFWKKCWTLLKSKIPKI